MSEVTTDTGRAELLGALAAGAIPDAPSGLKAQEGATPGALPSAKPTVLEVDHWGLRRGEQIVQSWGEQWQALAEQIKAAGDKPPEQPAPHDSRVAADAHEALFSLEPKFAERPSDEGRALWWKQLMDTPEYQALHAKTVLDPAMSELAAKNLCDQWVTYVAEHPDVKPNESIGDTMARIRSCADALKGAGDTVDTARDVAAGLGMGADGQALNPKDLAAYFNLVRNDDFLRQLMRLAGRMRTLCQTLQRTKTQHGRDDTVGVELGGDVARLVPSELGQLASGVPELELLALDRLARKQSLCRKYRANEQLGKGPIVVVVDESGSMGGDPIMTAKALALALAWLARQQRRWIALVGFSGGTEGNLVAFPPGGMDQNVLIDWLTHFYGGGTTLDVPLDQLPNTYWPAFMAHGLTRGRTDVILITDAIVHAPDSMIDNYVAWAKAEQVRTYGIIIGEPSAGDIARVATRYWCVPDLGTADAAIEAVLSI